MRMSIDDIEPGMIVGREVRNMHGQVLIRAGAELSTKHARVLRTWGIASVHIQVEAEEADQNKQIQRHHVEAAAIDERRRFAHCDLGHDVVHHLYRHAVKRRAQRMANGESA